MYDELEGLRDRINQLSNEELIQMVNIDYEQYRKETLDYAEAEMQKRGLKIEQVSFEDSSQEEDAEALSVDSEYLKPDEEIGQEVSYTSQVEFRVFRGALTSWEQLFSEAAAFATEVGPLKLINISHSEDSNEGVVTVWYWT
jgi:hypothetical protein